MNVLSHAKLNDILAQIALALCYEKGDGVEQSDKKAIKEYTKVAEQEDTFTQNRRSWIWIYDRERDVEQSDNDIKSIKWYNKATGQEPAEIFQRPQDIAKQCNLSRLYCYPGQDIEQDDTKPILWHHISTKQYNPLLFYYCDPEQNVKQDDTEVVKWYKGLIVQGLAEAQCPQGIAKQYIFEHIHVYAQEQRVEQNDTETITWHHKAMEQGHIRSTIASDVYVGDRKKGKQQRNDQIVSRRRRVRKLTVKRDFVRTFLLGTLNPYKDVFIYTLQTQLTITKRGIPCTIHTFYPKPNQATSLLKSN